MPAQVIVLVSSTYDMPVPGSPTCSRPEFVPCLPACLPAHLPAHLPACLPDSQLPTSNTRLTFSYHLNLPFVCHHHSSPHLLGHTSVTLLTVDGWTAVWRPSEAPLPGQPCGCHGGTQSGMAGLHQVNRAQTSQGRRKGGWVRERVSGRIQGVWMVGGVGRV